MAITKIIANTPQTPNNSDAQDWASMLNAIVGDVSGVLTYGNELEVEIVNDNKIKIKDGVYSLQGHMIRIHEGTDLELTVNSGTLGVKRIDLLVVTYEKNINNQQDDVFEFEVVQGDAIASNDGNPTPPSITQNDLLEGGTKRQEVLYELHLNETTLSLVDKRKFVTSVHELENRVEDGMGRIASQDYEEGTWTATLIGSVSPPDTAITVVGRYTRYGNLVTVTFAFYNVNTTGASGTLRITGLPFVSKGSHFAYGNGWTNGLGDNVSFPQASHGQSYIEYKLPIGSSNLQIVPGTGKSVYGSVTYWTV